MLVADIFAAIDPYWGILTTGVLGILGAIAVQRIKVNSEHTANEAGQAAAAVVNAHLDNGLHATLKRLDVKLTEVGVTVDAVVKAQDRPIFKTEPGGALIYANPAALKMLGMTQSQLNGDGWVQAVHPEDRARVFSEWARCISLKQEFGPVVYRYRHPVTREEIWVEAVAVPVVDIDGGILSWVATVMPVVGMGEV